MMFNFLIGIIFLLLHDVSAQNECLTPSGKNGICVLINQCDSMSNLIESAGEDKLSQQYINAFQLLTASICAYEGNKPKVCCELSTSPPPPPDVTNHPKLGLLDHDSCGVFSSDKIFGGSTTGVFEYPWMALIGYRIGNMPDLSFSCAGTIINNRYILTAAHCVTALPKNYILQGVRVGEHDLSTLIDCDTSFDQETQNWQYKCAEGFQNFGIESYHVHPQYSPITFHNDIALIRLNRNINFVPENVKPICLPIGSAARFYGNKGTVTGWGKTENASKSFTLLKAKIPVKPYTECAAKFPANSINYKQMCAGGEPGVDSCSGDSGGPLQNAGNYNSVSKNIQYGIVSYGKACGLPGIPAVYTSVPYYMDWILDTMRN